jgi:hypothetical protein
MAPILQIYINAYLAEVSGWASLWVIIYHLSLTKRTLDAIILVLWLNLALSELTLNLTPRKKTV